MPPRLNVDPNLLEPPDFTSDIFAAARNAIAAAPDTTDEQAIEILKAGWTADIQKKKEQWAQQRQEEDDADEAVRIAREEEVEKEKEEAKNGHKTSKKKGTRSDRNSTL